MSSNRPPQLHLSVHAENGTSFKRSFEQFGFDLDTPLSSEAGGSTSSSIDSGSGNDRNKRARSESSISNSDEIAESSGSSEAGAASSTVTSVEDGLSGLSATRPNSLADGVTRLTPHAEPPRLPTPHFEDIQMSILDDSEPLSSSPVLSANQDESYRISLERFNTFESEISVLRQPPTSASPPIIVLPPISPVADGEDGEAQARPSHQFMNFGLVAENSNIPGLQVFALGEVDSSEDRREASRRFFDRPDENRTSGAPSQNVSREPLQPRFSTPGRHDYRIENPGPSREQLPPALPQFSPSPLFSQQDLEWWSSELSNGDSSTRPPSRPRHDAPPRVAADHMPPRNWIGTPFSYRDRRMGNPSTFAGPSWARRRDIARSRDPRRRHIEVADDDLDEDHSVLFPTVAQLEQDRYEHERSVFDQHPIAEHLSSEEHRQSGNWQPFERVAPPLRPRISLAQRSHEAVADVRRRASDSRFRLPRIESSDSDLGLRSHHLLDRMNPRRPPSQRSSDSPSSLASNLAAVRRSSGVSADRTVGRSTFFRRPTPFHHGVNSNADASDLPPSASDEDDAESSEMDWSEPSYHTGNDSGRIPPSVREHTTSRLYSSRVAASNSLVSENAAELRRSMARSHMLQTLPQDDDLLDDFPTLSDPDRLARTRREAARVPWIWPADRLASDSFERDRSSNPLLRPYSSSTSQNAGRLDNGSRRFDLPLSPSSSSSFVRGVATAPANLSRDSTEHDEFTLSQVAAMSATSPPSSPGLGLQPRDRQIPQRARTFSSSVDTSRGISTTSPAWEDVIAAYSPLAANSPISRQTDHGLRTRATQRSSLVDTGNFRSPSSLSPVERAPHPLEPPRPTPVSTYRGLDLSAYHEGPFRASLQRYVDLDRMRSRLTRSDSTVDNMSSQTTSSSQPPFPPTLPPLRFDSEDDLSENASHRALNSGRPPTSYSPTDDQDLNFPRLVREARLGRGSFRPPAALQRTQNYGPDIDENESVMETNLGADWVAQGTFADSSINHSASPYLLENESRRQMERFIAYDRMRSYRNQALSSGSVNALPSRPISPVLPRFDDVHLQSNRLVEERVNNGASIRARSRAQMGPRAQTRLDIQRAENAGANGFSEAMNNLSADGLSNSTQRQFFDRYQRARDAADLDGISVANDARDNGSRFWPARARYARRARLHRPSQSGESGTSAYRPRASSHSPTRDGGASERLVATAILADRSVRLRPTREMLQRDREFMQGDFPRFNLVHLAQRPGRNMGDYMRDEDFDSSYESLLTLASTLGEARPKATPSHVIAALPTGFYKDWQTADSDQRCPICLDDYKPLDPVLKLSDCPHWLHKECLEQWLHGANTCPVCRKRVNDARCPRQRRGSGQGPTPSGSNRMYHGHNAPGVRHLPEGFGLGTPPWRLWE